MGKTSVCKFDGCESLGRIRTENGKKVYRLTLGFCNTHYLKLTRFGTPEGTKRGYNDGRSKHPLYSIYKGMIKRCYAEDSQDYAAYGARGIKVEDAWLLEGGEGFKNFVMAMGERPVDYTLDRKDNGKGYSAENCRWASMHQQARNKRNNSEHIGVYFNKHNRQWVAELSLRGQKVFRKGFLSMEEAISAREMADEKFGVVA